MLMFQSERMLARKFTRVPLCPGQWPDATKKSELSQNLPARSSLVSDGERCPVSAPLKEGKP
jgi:hypothetical protein